MMRLASTLVSLLALGLVLGVGGAANAGEVPTLGADGEVYRVERGTYGELFPGGLAAAPTNPVLALDVYRPDRAVERLLVPTTEDEFPEDSPAIILDPASQTPFLVWERWKNFIHPELNLVQLTAAGWTEVAEISGNPFRQKSSPAFAITHDSDLRVDDGGQLVPRSRTIVHLVWLETEATGALNAQYAPVVIEDGAYLGSNPIYKLNDLLDGLSSVDGASVSSDLERAVAIGPGDEAQSVNIAFTAVGAGRIAAVTARVLPRDLTAVSDALREGLIAEFGGNFVPTDPASVGAVADLARHQLVDFGNRLQTGFVAALAAELTQFILEHGPIAPDIETLAASVGARTAIFGSNVLRSGIAPVENFARHQLVDFGNRVEGGLDHHQIQLGLVSARPAPATGAGKTTVLVSRPGDDLLVAWEHDGVLSYRETRGDDWSQEFVLRPESADGLTAAYQALRDRIRDR